MCILNNWAYLQPSQRCKQYGFGNMMCSPVVPLRVDYLNKIDQRMFVYIIYIVVFCDNISDKS